MKRTRYSCDFIMVVIGQIISIVGNQIVRYALPLYLLNQTGSAAWFGTISALAFIPMLLLYPIGGMLADRFPRKSILVLLDFMLAGVMGLFWLAEGIVDSIPLIAITMVVLYGIQGAYQPAVQVSIPGLVPGDKLIQANSIVNLVHSLASMAGPVLGGILYSVTGLTPIIYVSIGCFFVSAVMELFIRIPYHKPANKGTILQTGREDLKDSFCFIFQQQPVLWKISLVFAAVGLLLTALVLIVLPVVITQRLGFAPDTANRLYGYAQGVLAAGAVSGGVLAGTFSRKINPNSISLLLAGCGLSVLARGIALQFLADSVGIYLVLVTGSGILTALATVFQIQLMSYVQLLTPAELTGKVVSFVICMYICTLPLGQFIYGWVFEGIETRLFIPFYLAGLTVCGMSLGTRTVFDGIGSAMSGKQNG